MEQSLRYQAARRITLIGAAVNVILAFAKITFGVIGHSHALVADGVHSVADLSTDILVLFASRYGSQEADQNHPYGHRRIETAATLLLSLLLILAGIGIVIDAGEHFFYTKPVLPQAMVLWVAVFSVVANEILFRRTLFIGKQIQSELLRANAWHHRSDAWASLVVVVGVLGTLAGFIYLDVVAAIIVGCLVIKMGGQLGWSSVRELVDTGLDYAMVAKIKSVITAVPGVRMIHQLRTRTMGHAVFADVHILVAPYLSVSEGHYIGQQVYLALHHEMPMITDVTVQVDPEDDETVEPSSHLPARAELLARLQQCWQGLPGADRIESITLHYLAGKVQVDVCLPLSTVVDSAAALALATRYQTASESMIELKNVNVKFL
jgi:cation diffusion facilitator family transporter